MGDRNRAQPRFEYLLFDLGGVLVNFSGEADMMDWTALNREDLWQAWLQSPTVRQFERGETSPEVFAATIVHELRLPISAREFLSAFKAWPRTLYPGVLPLLDHLHEDYQLACMSNTNAVHWPYLRDTIGLGNYFERTFISYETGYLKPDPEAFQNVIQTLDCAAHQIAFFDDNKINTHGAERCGIRAFTVRGVEGLVNTLESLDILSPDVTGLT